MIDSEKMDPLCSSIAFIRTTYHTSRVFECESVHHHELPNFGPARQAVPVRVRVHECAVRLCVSSKFSNTRQN